MDFFGYSALAVLLLLISCQRPVKFTLIALTVGFVGLLFVTGLRNAMLDAFPTVVKMQFIFEEILLFQLLHLILSIPTLDNMIIHPKGVLEKDQNVLVKHRIVLREPRSENMPLLGAPFINEMDREPSEAKHPDRGAIAYVVLLLLLLSELSTYLARMFISSDFNFENSSYLAVSIFQCCFNGVLVCVTVGAVWHCFDSGFLFSKEAVGVLMTVAPFLGLFVSDVLMATLGPPYNPLCFFKLELTDSAMGPSFWCSPSWNYQRLDTNFLLAYL